MNFHYKIYGLQLSSSRRISILPESVNRHTDLSVIWSTDAAATPGQGLKWQRVLNADLKMRKGISFFSAESDEGVYLKFCFIDKKSDLCFLLGPDKKTLWVIHDKSELESDLDAYLVGPALGSVLRLRGVLCLHGSVVNINGWAVVFLGNKKAGKSTTAAAFVQKGFSVLADDLAVTTMRANRFYIQPGYPKLRLRPASVAALHPQMPDLPVVYSDRNSRFANIESNFHQTELPVAAIYVLSRSDETTGSPFIEKLGLHERLIELGKNTFGNYVVTTNEMRKEEFRILGLLTLNVPVSRLRVLYDLKNLNLQCQAVIEDVELLAKSTQI